MNLLILSKKPQKLAKNCDFQADQRVNIRQLITSSTRIALKWAYF